MHSGNIEEPLVTIGIPVHNSGKYLRQTLKSICQQTYKYIEIIISDNASDDNSCKIIEEEAAADPRIKYVRNSKNIGYAENVNSIIRLSRGKYVAIFHGDDIYAPTMLSKQVAYLEANPSCGGCFTLAKYIDKNGDEINHSALADLLRIDKNMAFDLQQYLFWLATIGNVLICPSSMIRRSVYQKVGGYRDCHHLIEDQDMWVRILEDSKLAIIADRLICYRIHRAQESAIYRRKMNIKAEISPSQKYLQNYLGGRKEYIELSELQKIQLAEEYIQQAKIGFFTFNIPATRQALCLAEQQLSQSATKLNSYSFWMVILMFVVSLARAILKRIPVS
jgi:glycosyltransferase involved in cell wall biosynthesis